MESCLKRNRNPYPFGYGFLELKGVIMLEVKRVKLYEINKARKFIKQNRRSNSPLSSDLTGLSIEYFLFGSSYFLKKNNKLAGIILISDSQKKVFFFSSVSVPISMFKFIYIINKFFSLNGYTFKARYKGINISKIKGKFPFRIITNHRLMHTTINNAIATCPHNLSVVPIRKNRDEKIRVYLQNKIFENGINRRDLTLSEVLSEEKSSKFIENCCFILNIDGTPSGYGQIIVENSIYYLVNFGIIPECRNLGYGYHFLSMILEQCLYKGINDLYLFVDYTNVSAFNLYIKAGFSELDNYTEIIL